MTIVSDILGAIGLTSDVAAAVAMAELQPTSANLQHVVSAYASQGMVVPGQLFGQLLQANKERYPADTYAAKLASAAMPWIILAVGALFLIMKRRRG